MAGIDSVLFDLDGTIVDSNEIIIRSYEHTYATHFPWVRFTRSGIIDTIGTSLETTFASCTDDPELIQAAMDTYMSYYRENEKALITLYPETRKTLKALKDRGVALAIVTTKFKTSAQPSIEHLGLDDFFEVVVGLDDVSNPKPDPESVFLARSRLEGTNRSLMVGDNPSDVLAGKRAGIESAGVSWSIKGAAALEAVDPDYMLTRMSDLIPIVDASDGGSPNQVKEE